MDSVFRTVLVAVFVAATPLVLVDVTVRDAVNLLALSLFCFSVSVDVLVTVLVAGTLGFVGAVAGRGFGGEGTFGELIAAFVVYNTKYT